MPRIRGQGAFVCENGSPLCQQAKALDKPAALMFAESLPSAFTPPTAARDLPLRKTEKGNVIGVERSGNSTERKALAAHTGLIS